MEPPTQCEARCTTTGLQRLWERASSGAAVFPPGRQKETAPTAKPNDSVVRSGTEAPDTRNPGHVRSGARNRSTPKENVWSASTLGKVWQNGFDVKRFRERALRRVMAFVVREGSSRSLTEEWSLLTTFCLELDNHSLDRFSIWQS